MADDIDTGRYSKSQVEGLLATQIKRGDKNYLLSLGVILQLTDTAESRASLLEDYDKAPNPAAKREILVDRYLELSGTGHDKITREDEAAVVAKFGESINAENEGTSKYQRLNEFGVVDTDVSARAAAAEAKIRAEVKGMDAQDAHFDKGSVEADALKKKLLEAMPVIAGNREGPEAAAKLINASKSDSSAFMNYANEITKDIKAGEYDRFKALVDMYVDAHNDNFANEPGFKRLRKSEGYFGPDAQAQVVQDANFYKQISPKQTTVEITKAIPLPVEKPKEETAVSNLAGLPQLRNAAAVLAASLDLKNLVVVPASEAAKPETPTPSHATAAAAKAPPAHLMAALNAFSSVAKSMEGSKIKHFFGMHEHTEPVAVRVINPEVAYPLSSSPKKIHYLVENARPETMATITINKGHTTIRQADGTEIDPAKLSKSFNAAVAGIAKHGTQELQVLQVKYDDTTSTIIFTPGETPTSKTTLLAENGKVRGH